MQKIQLNVTGFPGPHTARRLLPGNKTIYHGNETKNPPPAALIPPPAFPAKKNAFAPPPTRIATSESPAFPMRRAELAPEPQEESHGEWALALYDYTSQVIFLILCPSFTTE
ncbi:hypothetical protein C0992_012022 [Termitomyces sp. T32_za158]|nr:hypothetical protein C0992_012022 [Termitomyces sp. T32_za158]